MIVCVCFSAYRVSLSLGASFVSKKTEEYVQGSQLKSMCIPSNSADLLSQAQFFFLSWFGTSKPSTFHNHSETGRGSAIMYRLSWSNNY